MDDDRREGLLRFYSLLASLESKIGGARRLGDCSGRMAWPKRGVYFFQEQGENRSDTGDGPRIVRVGTHALTATSRTTLWKRLSQHRGSLKTGGGNHRGSIFRDLVGAALISRDRLDCRTWPLPHPANGGTRSTELAVERQVSLAIGNMYFVWLPIEDAPSPKSRRGYIEKNAIALLSNCDKSPLDAPSPGWLGHHSDRERVRKSGLWNQDHVNESCDSAFLNVLEELVSEVRQ